MQLRSFWYVLWAVMPLWMLPAVGDVDEGHSEWDYVLCVFYEGGKSTVQFGVRYNAEIVEYSCIESYLYFVTATKNLNPVQRNWLKDLYDKLFADEGRARNGQLPIRVRKEYRMLTAQERNRFHAALRAFKADPSQKYEALTSLHVGETARSAHHGPAYLVWNRIFLDLFELALREYDSRVTLPFWDSTLDSQLEQPTQSLIWSADFAGNGNGLVTTGPFADWTIDGRKLMRNIGESGRLMQPTDVSRIMTGEFTISDITFPNAAFVNNLELHSYGVRLWVGGDMALLQTAANDPMYFLLNAHIDCIWQDFRDVEESNGIDPEADWPVKFHVYQQHFPNRPLGVVPGVANRGGLRDSYGRGMYRCEKPACSLDRRSCGTSGALTCNVATGECEAVASRPPPEGVCQGSSGYQNSFCLDGNNCDERDWVYLPIQVAYVRPNEYRYPVRAFTSASSQETSDIYSPDSFDRGGEFNRSVSTDFPAPVVEPCRCANSQTGRVYVQSYGLNYNGTYREYSAVDKRLPLSSTWTYVGLKDPRDAPDFRVRALIRVYDDCGRICLAYCRVKGSEIVDEYVKCSGVLTISTKEPKQYSETMEGVFYINWDFRKMNLYPEPIEDITFLKFYCDHSSLWPWLTYGYIEDPYKPRPSPPTDPDIEDLFTTTTTTPTTPTTTFTTTTTTTTPTTTVLIKSEWCFNGTQCFKDHEATNCTRCEHNTFTYCWDHCGKYLQCSKGVWYVKNCTEGLLWEDAETVKTCNYQDAVVCRPNAWCTGCKTPSEPLPPPLPRPRNRTRTPG